MRESFAETMNVIIKLSKFYWGLCEDDEFQRWLGVGFSGGNYGLMNIISVIVTSQVPFSSYEGR